MRFRVKLDYKTTDDELLYLEYGDSSVALISNDGRAQEVEFSGSNTVVYNFFTARPKQRRKIQKIRQEWGSRTISAKKSIDSIYVVDRWQDMPSDRSFYSTLFTQSVFKRTQPISEPLKKSCVVVAVDVPVVKPTQNLLIVGSHELLGSWDVSKAIKMLDGEFPTWKSPSLKITEELLSSEFKFVLVDSGDSTVLWEEGENRTFEECSDVTEDSIYLNLRAAKFDIPQWQGSGVAIPVFSIRTEDSMGVGEFLDLKKMVDWAVLAGQKIIQILPVNDTTMTRTPTDSYPYNAISIYALHPQYISPLAVGEISDNEQLEEFKSEGKRLNSLPQIDYGAVNSLKERYMQQLYIDIGSQVLASSSFKQFFKRNSYWLESYALFCYLRDKYSTVDFAAWDKDSRFSEKLLSKYCSKKSKSYKSIAYYYFIQYNLHIQLLEAREYAQSRGVTFKGDIPIGVSPNSVDVWIEPTLFNLTMQAGAPPDDFAVKGQNWGFPTYNWKVMAKDNYAWWSARFSKMSEYFDAYRIDHILGFFRIWEIPVDAVDGLLGHFSPALPFSVDELRDNYGFTFDLSQVEPDINDWLLNEIFGEESEGVITKYLTCKQDGTYQFKRKYNTQRKLSQLVDDSDLLEKLLSLFCEVLFVEDPYQKRHYHPRISVQNSYKYRAMSSEDKAVFDRLYHDFYYSRHNQFWKSEALRKLPTLINATNMLTCGEDLGMIPACVSDVMEIEQILSLEIQRMPKEPYVAFGDPMLYPYRSVSTTSTHDMNPLRAWLLEDKELSKRYLKAMFDIDYDIESDCDGWVCQKIIEQHLQSPSMWTIIPLQDLLSIDNDIRNSDPHNERINVPSNSRHYWRYRMHCSIEELIENSKFNSVLHKLSSR